MEFPHGHHHHHHHHHHHKRRDDDDDDERPTYAPPPPGVNFAAAPPPSYSHVSHVHHSSGDPYLTDYRYGGYAPPPSQDFPSESYPPPPPRNPAPPASYGEYAEVSHVSHHHSHMPHHMPLVPHHRRDENRLPANLAGKPTVRVYCKAETDYYLTISDGKVVLAQSNPADVAQHWYKDEKYSTKVKDSEGCPCFALVNKATGEAMKHSLGAGHPVQLIPYDPDKLDESILWTQSKDLGDGYRTIRMVNNVHLNVDAYHGDKKSGGVRDGTLIVLWDWNKGDNQLWKILPFCKFLLKHFTARLLPILWTDFWERFLLQFSFTIANA